MFILVETPRQPTVKWPKRSAKPIRNRRRFVYQPHPEEIVRRALQAEQAGLRPYLKLVVDNIAQNHGWNK